MQVLPETFISNKVLFSGEELPGAVLQRAEDQVQEPAAEEPAEDAGHAQAEDGQHEQAAGRPATAAEQGDPRQHGGGVRQRTPHAHQRPPGRHDGWHCRCFPGGGVRAQDLLQDAAAVAGGRHDEPPLHPAGRAVPQAVQAQPPGRHGDQHGHQPGDDGSHQGADHRGGPGAAAAAAAELPDQRALHAAGEDPGEQQAARAEGRPRKRHDDDQVAGKAGQQAVLHQPAAHDQGARRKEAQHDAGECFGV